MLKERTEGTNRVPPDFSIVPTWESAVQESEQIRWTAAYLRITLNGHVLTRAEDDRSKPVRDEVFLSTYPLALWFASSWWRLCWEPAPDAGPTRRSLSWRMAHEMTAVGYGFVWPHLVFESDGESVAITCQPSERQPTAPLRYLDDLRGSIPVAAFEAAVSTFVDSVLARLDAVATPDIELGSIWREVVQERADPEATAYRQLEARLGFDPDEAPEHAMERLQDLSSDAGDAAISEIAPACSGSDPVGTLTQVIELAASPGIQGRTPPLPELRGVLEDPGFRSGAPWERGRLLARTARTACELKSDPVEDDVLSEILSVGADTFRAQPTVPAQQPIGLAVRDGTRNQLRFLFRKRNHLGRRFEAARFLADNLIAPIGDRWLPTTDSRTARQKVQRAFATEFLCPIKALEEYLDGDLSRSRIEDAGEYFDVSPFAIESHLMNNGVLPKSWCFGEYSAG